MEKNKKIDDEIYNLKASLALALGAMESVRYLINYGEDTKEKKDHIKQILDNTLFNIEQIAE
jgi:hypothetical protein